MSRISKYISLIVIIGGLVACNTDQKLPQIAQDQQVLDLMGKMSTEEKVGQMTQVTLSAFIKEGTDHELDQEKLRFAIVEKKIGSILNNAGHAYSKEDWHEIIKIIQDISINETPNKIPNLYGIDAIHGSNYTLGATLFPHNIGMAAARNPTLVAKAAKITAMEVRASGIRWNFDPTLGVGRQPLWSRFEETYGEDTYLGKTMGAAAIQAYEEDGLKNVTAVASCMKHYLGYSDPRSGKDRTPSYIPDRQLREIFLPAFESATAAGASTVMINSGEINGIPVHASSYYLQDILRGELGFKGLAVSDWEDIQRLYLRHKVASSQKEAVKMAVNAGIDMSMVPTDCSFFDLLLELVNEGEVSMARIDEAVYRILKLKFDLGLFDNAYVETEAIANFGKPEYKEVALEAALQSITLLKNEKDLLPLSKSAKILLAGPAANNVTTLHSSWSFTWQGNAKEYYPESTLTILQALQNVVGANNVWCQSSADFNDANNYNTAFIAKNATQADVIVLALGEKAYAETPGGIDDLRLDQNQIDLAIAAYKTGKPVVLLLAQGRPRVIAEIVDEAGAVLNLYRPASQGATATAQILFGDYNPNGKLPFSYPRSTNDLLTYDRKHTEEIKENVPDTYEGGGYNPQWPFGFGLSYTTFELSDLTIDKNSIGVNDVLNITVNASNTGKMDGQLALDLFISDKVASVTPSVLKLKKFQKVSIKSGESTKVSFTLNKTDLSFINQENKRVTENGEFDILVGKLKTTFIYQE